MLFLLFSLFSGLLPAHVAAGLIASAVTKSCFNVSIPVTVTSTNFIWGLPEFSSNLDVTALNIELNRRNFAASLDPFSGTQTETASYKIAGTFCEPSDRKASALLLATHGATLDRHYWDFPYQPSNYSFVDFAITKGYSVFFYDRVGAGESTVISGYVTQIPIHVVILEQLVQWVRSGSLLLAGAKTTSRKIVLVGHSLGSIVSNALLASNPTIADGAVLTGWSPNSGLLDSSGDIFATMQAKIAETVNPTRWSAWDSGFITFIDIYSYIQVLYKVGFFDFSVANLADSLGWPLSIMEFFTIFSLNYVSQTTVPILFLIGSDDYLLCQGDCTGVFLQAVPPLFPKSVGFEAYIQPNTGHILNTAYNATGGYKVITDFLGKNGF